MSDKNSSIILTVDLSCGRCRNKIKKILCKYRERWCIQSDVWDEKNDKITLTGPFCPHRLAKKLRRKACMVIKEIDFPDECSCKCDPPPSSEKERKEEEEKKKKQEEEKKKQQEEEENKKKKKQEEEKKKQEEEKKEEEEKKKTPPSVVVVPCPYLVWPICCCCPSYKGHGPCGCAGERDGGHRPCVCGCGRGCRGSSRTRDDGCRPPPVPCACGCGKGCGGGCRTRDDGCRIEVSWAEESMCRPM